MIDYVTTILQSASVHHIGNKTNNEDLRLSKTLLDIEGPNIKELLSAFFLNPFAAPEFYEFTFTNKDISLNPVFTFATGIFDDAETLHDQSLNIATHLYERSLHPQIKSGDLFVVYFTNCNVEGETLDAVGIFKSENRQPFLKVDTQGEEFTIRYEDGINIEKLDKGCLIFNTNKATGYRVCVIDKSNKSVEAQFWKDDFLQLQPCKDDYHHTKEFMNITKNFVTKQFTEDFDVSKADQIDLLNRSVDYFKTHDTFVKKDFEKRVLNDPAIIGSFRDFEGAYRTLHESDANDNFEISVQAVKKQARVFKSVLKLDKNFHIYIHGNRELIEQGVERDGRKFYKIYFEKEL
jgi:hypothetical protein